jgi:hypothetical protein
VVDSALQEVASRGDVTGSLERATTGRSDKKNFYLPNGQWFFLSLMDEHGGRGAEPGDALSEVRCGYPAAAACRWARLRAA